MYIHVLEYVKETPLSKFLIKDLLKDVIILPCIRTLKDDLRNY